MDSIFQYIGMIAASLIVTMIVWLILLLISSGAYQASNILYYIFAVTLLLSYVKSEKP